MDTVYRVECDSCGPGVSYNPNTVSVLCVMAHLLPAATFFRFCNSRKYHAKISNYHNFQGCKVDLAVK